MAINEKYSFKDFTGRTFLDVDPAEFSGTTIKGSCFCQENAPRSSIFPVGMIGVTFERCNLDNIEVPPGNVVGERCTHQQCLCQNDGLDWVVNEQDQPVEPLGPKMHEELGLSVNPKDLPLDKIVETEVTKKEFDAAKNWTAKAEKGNEPPKGVDFWYKEKPAIVETNVTQETIEVENWNRIDAFHFDSLPTDIGTRLRKFKTPASVEMRPVKILRGPVTRHRIRGKAWRFRGEE